MPHVGCARPAWVRVKSSMLKPSVNNLISRLTSAFPFPCLARSSSLFTNWSLGRRLCLHVDRSALRPWLRIGSTLVRRNSSERMSVSQFFLYWQTSSQWPDRQLRNPTSVLPFEHVSELSICSLISSHPPRIPVKTGLQKSCVQSRACIERSDLWMARLLFTVLFCPQVRTKPQLSTPNLSEDTFLWDPSSKSFCTNLPNRSVIETLTQSFLVRSPPRVACLFVPYLDKAVNVSSSFMRYGRHFNRVTWLLVNAHLPARHDSDYLQLAKGFSAKKLHYWRIPSLGHFCADTAHRGIW